MKPIEVIGNEHILNPLRTAIIEDALCSCYLIEGPEGSGKKTIASYLCALIACENPQDGKPCFFCRGCENVGAFTHPDIFILSPEEKAVNISVSVVREANRAATSAPMSAKKRVFLIPEAERLGIEAQNALLKNMEEPSSQAVYFLLASESSVLLPTVLSRAVRYRTQSLEEDVVFDFLCASNPKADKEQCRLAARICGGSLGMAKRYLEDRKFQLRRETVERYLDLLCENASFVRFCEVLPLDTKKDALRLFYPLLLAALRDALLCKSVGDAAKTIFLNTADEKRFAALDEKKLMALIESLCRFLDPSMQNAYAAGSVSLLNSRAASNG